MDTPKMQLIKMLAATTIPFQVKDNQVMISTDTDGSLTTFTFTEHGELRAVKSNK